MDFLVGDAVLVCSCRWIRCRGMMFLWVASHPAEAAECGTDRNVLAPVAAFYHWSYQRQVVCCHGSHLNISVIIIIIICSSSSSVTDGTPSCQTALLITSCTHNIRSRQSQCSFSCSQFCTDVRATGTQQCCKIDFTNRLAEAVDMKSDHNHNFFHFKQIWHNLSCKLHSYSNSLTDWREINCRKGRNHYCFSVSEIHPTDDRLTLEK